VWWIVLAAKVVVEVKENSEVQKKQSQNIKFLSSFQEQLDIKRRSSTIVV
jgi:hypothetical protein